MKTQVAWNFRRSRTELQVTPGRRETLDIRGAEWLQGVQSELLLPLDYDPDKARTKKLELAYDITGLTALKKRLPRVWTQERYYTTLEGIERVCAECASGTRLIERILFDIDHVYLTEDYEPRFVYVPFEGVAYDASQNSPLLVLGALAGRRMRFDSAAGQANAASLRQWALTKQVFSLNDYRAFLDREFPTIRAAARNVTSSWDERENGPSDSRIAFMDSLFAGFGDASSTGDSADASADGARTEA